MKYYTSTTEFNCRIDLHARQMYVCVMDRQGKKLVHCNVKDNDFEYFLKLIKPYRHDITICAECMFGWYWLADACQEAGLTFVLAHALYVHLIPAAKTKTIASTPKSSPICCVPTLFRPPTSILRPDGRCARCCVSGSSTCGVAPNCWPASIPINWPIIVLRPNRLAASVTPG